MNVFEAVKQSVSTRQAAQAYGIPVRRNNMAVCPFHNDKNPSMKINDRFYCFGCLEKGDVIDFTAKLYGLGNLDAAKKLASDFGISYDNQRYTPQPKCEKKITAELRFKQSKVKCYRVLTDYLHLLRNWEKEYAPKSIDEIWHPRFVEALEHKTYTEYLIDILLFGTVEDSASLIIEYGKKVNELERRIAEFRTADETGIATSYGLGEDTSVRRRNKGQAR